MTTTSGASARQAFKVADFRYLVLASTSTEAARLIQRVALFWLVLVTTGSAVHLGVFGGMFGLSSLLLGPWTEPLVVTYGARRVLIAARLIQAASALGLGVVILVDALHLWLLYVAALLNIGAGAVGAPMDHLLTYDVVGRELVKSALGLRGLLVGAMRVIGPSSGGLLVGVAGIGAAFAVQSALFVIAVMLLVRVRGDTRRASAGAGGRRAFVKAMRYAVRHRDVAFPLLAATLVSAFVFPYLSFLPVFVAELEGSPQAFGAVASAAGLGTIVGGVIAVRGRGGMRTMLWMGFGYATLILAFTQMPALWLEFAALALAGVAVAVWQALNPALAQLNAGEESRPGVMGLYNMTFSFEPASLLALGFLVDRVGVRAAVGSWVAVAAVGMLILAVVESTVRDGDADQPC